MLSLGKGRPKFVGNRAGRSPPALPQPGGCPCSCPHLPLPQPSLPRSHWHLMPPSPRPPPQAGRRPPHWLWLELSSSSSEHSSPSPGHREVEVSTRSGLTARGLPMLQPGLGSQHTGGYFYPGLHFLWCSGHALGLYIPEAWTAPAAMGQSTAQGPPENLTGLKASQGTIQRDWPPM